MEKKRFFYCDWALSPSDESSDYSIKKVLLISIMVVAIIYSALCCGIVIPNHSKNLDSYFNDAYEYLDAVANTVISEDGINISSIPKDIAEYEITHKNGEIIFKYSLTNNTQSLIASTNMTITLSEDFEILNKNPKCPSKEKYVKVHKIRTYALRGVLTWSILAIIVSILMTLAIPISMVHKKFSQKEVKQ